jgi:hypothetical protein
LKIPVTLTTTLFGGISIAAGDGIEVELLPQLLAPWIDGLVIAGLLALEATQLSL